jgi:hypothetical protein
MEGECLVLSLVERGERVSFDEAWHTLQISSVRTYVL